MMKGKPTVITSNSKEFNNGRVLWASELLETGWTSPTRPNAHKVVKMVKGDTFIWAKHDRNGVKL